jgi:hypothetical protein
VVGIVYQVALRRVWEPTGMQKAVDEILHSVIPLLTLMYWLIYAQDKDIQVRAVLSWMIYPVIYLIFVIVRGILSGFYPYPFLNIPEIGVVQTIINVFLILVFAILLFMLLYFLKKLVFTH